MTTLVAKQHLLPSLRWLIQRLARDRAFSTINLLVKDYSAIPGLEHDLVSIVKFRRSEAECFLELDDNDVVLLDEGGGLHASLPESLAPRTSSVEQTTFGLRTSWNCPTVLVCRSAAKLLFESQIVARGILRKIDSLGILDGGIVGVIGLGALGSEVARVLMDRGIPILGADTNGIPVDLRPIAASQDALLKQCSLVLGCSGRDTLAEIDIGSFGGKKLFVSCSSSNIEFRSVLARLPACEPFGTVHGWIGRTRCAVLNSGYPINFDREQEWELFDEIVLTRKLVLEGLLQAKSFVGTAPRGIMLDPEVQLRVVSDWLEKVPDRQMLRVPESLTVKFFRDFSEGECAIAKKPHYTLHHTTPGALAGMRSHTKSYDAQVMGLPILVLPNVWSPAYDWSSLFFIENMPALQGLEFLEIGCGTGVISVFAARCGASRVVATDISEQAVRNAQLNFERFGLETAEVSVSDGFANVRGEFDIVVWNAPYHGTRPADVLERGCADENYRGIRAFFRDVAHHLKPGGRIVFGFSESGDLPLVESLIAASGFYIRRRLSDWRQDYNCMLFDLTRARSQAPSPDGSN